MAYANFISDLLSVVFAKYTGTNKAIWNGMCYNRT